MGWNSKRTKLGALLALTARLVACGGGGDVGEARHVDLGPRDAGTGGLHADAAGGRGGGRVTDASVPETSTNDTRDAADTGSPLRARRDAAVPSADASNDGGPRCLPAPQLATGEECRSLPYNAAAESYVIWVADPTASGGGHRLSLDFNATATVNGHTYRNTGAGLFGGGSHGVYGDVSIDVDGVSSALAFHIEGCAVSVSSDLWELGAAVTRTNPLATTSAPESIERSYVVRHSGSGSTGRYTFDAEGAPEGCASGVDLLQVVLPD